VVLFFGVVERVVVWSWVWFFCGFVVFFFFLQDVCAAVSTSFDLPSSGTVSEMLAAWSSAQLLLIQPVCWQTEFCAAPAALSVL